MSYSDEPRLFDRTEALLKKNNKQLSRESREALLTYFSQDELMQGHFAINPVLWNIVYGEMARLTSNLQGGCATMTQPVNVPVETKPTTVKVDKKKEPEPEPEEPDDGIFDLFG